MVKKPPRWPFHELAVRLFFYFLFFLFLFVIDKRGRDNIQKHLLEFRAEKAAD